MYQYYTTHTLTQLHDLTWLVGDESIDCCIHLGWIQCLSGHSSAALTACSFSPVFLLFCARLGLDSWESDPLPVSWKPCVVEILDDHWHRLPRDRRYFLGGCKSGATVSSVPEKNWHVRYLYAERRGGKANTKRIEVAWLTRALAMLPFPSNIFLQPLRNCSNSYFSFTPLYHPSAL